MIVSITKLENMNLGNNATVGGGLYLGDSRNATVLNCSFENNTARLFGGAICANDSSILTLQNSSLVSNEAMSKGGAAAIIGDASVICLSSTFMRNQAEGGGGLYISSNTTVPIIAQLQSSRIENNFASNYGG